MRGIVAVQSRQRATRLDDAADCRIRQAFTHMPTAPDAAKQRAVLDPRGGQPRLERLPGGAGDGLGGIGVLAA